MSASRLTMPINTTKTSALREASLSRVFVMSKLAAVQYAELCRQLRIEQFQIFFAHASHHPLGLLCGHDEIHTHGLLPGQFQEMRFMHNAMAAVACNGTESRPARDAEFLCLSQQPVVQQHAMVAAVLVHEETQIHALCGSGTHARFLAPYAIAKPSSVIASEPTRCSEMSVRDHAYSCRSSSVTVSPENVEKVVSPPRNPGVMNNRNSGDSEENCANAPIVMPMIKPPSRLAASVPSGMVGNSGLNEAERVAQTRAQESAAAGAEKCIE